MCFFARMSQGFKHYLYELLALRLKHLEAEQYSVRPTTPSVSTYWP
jgi:hypothetical protein